MQSAAERLDAIRSRIQTAAQRAGRDPKEVHLIAVSKTHSSEQILELCEAGQWVFGENRIQEAKAKIPALPNRAEWHLIGHLQKNKIRAALPLFTLIHSVDSLETAEQIQRIATEEGRRVRALIEINVALESSKFGYPPDSLRHDFEKLLALDRIDFEGLMSIPPAATDPDQSRRYFAGLREMQQRLQTEFRAGLPELSMGMSADFEVAVEEGATYVRVGTALFGARPPNPEVTTLR